MINFKELAQDGIGFEQMVRELLIRSGFEVHWTGVGPDSGRDLVVIEKSKGMIAGFNRKWLVSCKHYANSGKSVGINDVQDITDACEAIGAQGYLLVTSTQPSSAVVKRFEEIEQRGKLVVKYWDSIEIEKRLNTPNTFPIISLFFPETSKSMLWKIYNTNSPDFWVANYKDYYIYMGSRTANSFPSLEDIEVIVNKLESIELPKSDKWSSHKIRVRAVYFDNKHEHYCVFADYLFPIGEEEFVLKPSQIDSYLDDGSGLYSEGNFEWYLTNWDIKYIPTNQMSEHFHSDHKDYYTKYISNFKVGYERDGFISELYDDDFVK